MGTLMVVLAAIGYGTAAIVGLRLLLRALVKLFPEGQGKAYFRAQAEVPRPAEAIAHFVLLAVGIVLVLQGLVIGLWVLS